MKTFQAIAKLERQRNLIEELKRDTDSSSDPTFKKWQRDTRITIERAFGEDSSHRRDFTKIHFFPRVSDGTETQADDRRYYHHALDHAFVLLQSLIQEIQEYWHEDESEYRQNAVSIIKNICTRFHLIVRQIWSRHENRATLDVEDEYDAQDLFHALLYLILTISEKKNGRQAMREGVPVWIF